MKPLLTKFYGSLIFFFVLQSGAFAQDGTELYCAHFYKNWFDLFDHSIVLDSLQFSVSEKTDRYVLVDRVLNPKSGKLRRKDFGGYAFKIGEKYYAQHMLYTEYLNDIPLLVRFHVLGMYGAVFVATDDPVIGLERHSYTGLGILGDAVADAIKNRKDRSNKVWKGEDGSDYSIVFYASILNDEGNVDQINPDIGLLSEMVLDVLVDKHNMPEEYSHKTDWTAEEIGVFLTEINEAEGKSIVKFEGLDFSSIAE